MKKFKEANVLYNKSLNKLNSLLFKDKKVDDNTIEYEEEFLDKIDEKVRSLAVVLYSNVLLLF